MMKEDDKRDDKNNNKYKRSQKKDFIQQTPLNTIKTITCDRGKEFSGYKEIEALFNIEIYFTDPYCAWQKKQ